MGITDQKKKTMEEELEGKFGTTNAGKIIKIITDNYTLDLTEDKAVQIIKTKVRQAGIIVDEGELQLIVVTIFT